MRVSSFPLLPHSLSTLLGALVDFLPVVFGCVLSVLGVFLFLVLLLFLPVLILFLGYFSEGSPVFFAFSPLRRLPLLLLLLGVLHLLLLLLLPLRSLTLKRYGPVEF